MNNNLWMSVVLMLAAGVSVVGYVLVLLIAALKWRDFPRPSKLLAAAAALALFSSMAGGLLPWGLSRIAAPGAMSAFVVLINGCRTILHLVSIGLMVMAIYVDRSPGGTSNADEFLPGDRQRAPWDTNPFVHPDESSGPPST